MKCQSVLCTLHQASMALQVNSVPLSETIDARLAAPLDRSPSVRAPARRPEIEVSGMAPRHSLRDIVDDVEDAEAPSIGELVVDEVEGPACIRPSLRPGSAPACRRPCGGLDAYGP